MLDEVVYGDNAWKRNIYSLWLTSYEDQEPFQSYDWMPQRGTHCVYQFGRGGTIPSQGGPLVIYVGVSSNIRSRLKQHSMNLPLAQMVDSIHIGCFATRAIAEMVEALYILKLQPDMNIVGRDPL